jgi:hypothetical protein
MTYESDFVVFDARNPIDTITRYILFTTDYRISDVEFLQRCVEKGIRRDF